MHSTKFVDHYAVLGVKSDATLVEIKSAFYEQSKLHHPDTNPESSRESVETFQQVSQVRMFPYFCTI